MTQSSDSKLDRLLREAYSSVEVSPDFTLRLWRRLMKAPVRPPWMLPVPVGAVAVAIGVAVGVISWGQFFAPSASYAQAVRLDLFGNAPLDTVAGTYLTLTKGDAS